MKFKRQAFTLVEILVVIVIVAILASLLLAVFSRVREQSRKTTCASNLKQIGLAFLQYAQDNSETFPPAFQGYTGKPFDRIQPYIRNTQILACPSDVGDYGPNPDPLYKREANNFTSYSYNSGVSAGPTSFCMLPQNSTPPKGVDKLNLSQVKSPTRVALVLETSGIYPWSWHENFAPLRNNARSNVCFVDGHVKFIKIFHDDTNFPEFTDFAACYDPPGTANQTSAYEYQWSAAP